MDLMHCVCVFLRKRNLPPQNYFYKAISTNKLPIPIRKIPIPINYAAIASNLEFSEASSVSLSAGSARKSSDPPNPETCKTQKILFINLLFRIYRF
jgi:hypothetical protein